MVSGSMVKVVKVTVEMPPGVVDDLDRISELELTGSRGRTIEKLAKLYKESHPHDFLDEI